ncbi:unnamed protein product, partial [Arabidopsis halleri]
MQFASICFDKLYGKDSMESTHLRSSIKALMKNLYEEYASRLSSFSQGGSKSDMGNSEQASDVVFGLSDEDGYDRESLYSEMDHETAKEEASSELDINLMEKRGTLGMDYDVLSWWRRNSAKWMRNTMAAEKIANLLAQMVDELEFHDSLELCLVKMIQTAICGVSQIEEIVCEVDRISALPEDLLVMILDLVPTKDAVATMFLSKRWLSVWTMKLRLEYKDSEEEEQVEEEEEEEEEEDDDDSDSDDSDDADSDDNGHVDSDDDDEHEEKVEDDEGKKSVWWFLEKSLQLHRAPVIDSLCIELGPSCPTDADVGKWVANAVDRCVLEMKFKLLWSADPAILPNTLYSCESLISLTLSDKILVDVPSSASFPSLKTLDLHHVVYKDDDSVVRFLSSCPVLETLCVKRNKKGDNVTKFTVKLPSLLIFTYDNNRRSPTPNDNDVGDTSGRCLVIDIPSAVSYFRIYDTSGDSCSIHMSCLDSTHMDLVSCPDDKFLVPLSSVSSLVLALTDALVEWCSTIKFYQLIECTICPEESDWMEPTLLLLGNSPKLKSLTIDYVSIIL